MRYYISIAFICLGIASFLTFNVYQEDERFKSFSYYIDKCQISASNPTCELVVENAYDYAFGNHDVVLLSPLDLIPLNLDAKQFEVKAVQNNSVVLQVDYNSHSSSNFVLYTINTLPGEVKKTSIIVTFVGKNLSLSNSLEIGVTQDWYVLKNHYIALDLYKFLRPFFLGSIALFVFLTLTFLYLGFNKKNL